MSDIIARQQNPEVMRTRARKQSNNYIKLDLLVCYIQNLLVRVSNDFSYNGKDPAKAEQNDYGDDVNALPQLQNSSNGTKEAKPQQNLTVWLCPQMIEPTHS